MPEANADRRPNVAESSDKRTEARHAVQPKRLLVHLADGETASATLLNLSKSGASMAVPHLIAPGQVVRFDVGSQVVLGEVSNTQLADDGVMIGIRISDVVPSPE